ncbi:hypothetical protein HG535_0D04590 [Zygotorulaspora mrakii]|uniref:Dit2p n=1 Tax=Zygotorulaspora mrakii TaxID=42260 RepID=A0A7H9B2B3_ZYGMR|nr:uncharacterized protein HG535_0D04590 [Zygotorulaspora mrakii]QLG72750.1 hypothetical protein HG535_0D04590 [Zygotorulaspora mrakii]
MVSPFLFESKMMQIILVVLLILFFYLAFRIVVPPLNFPRTIPTIPFYVIFLPSIFDIDQVDLFNLYLKEPLKKYGAAKIFFGSRWNIVVSKPEYLAQIFKDEETFAKSGNQKKIPYSVIAAYTGDNIISAHGEVWKTYRSIMANGLQQFDETPFYHNAKLFCDILQKKIGDKDEALIPISADIQRLCLDNISQVTLGFDFGGLREEYNPLLEHLVNIKKQIFHPFFLTFPFFDSFPIPARKKAFKEVEYFRQELVSHIQQQLIKNFKFEQTTFVSSDLVRAFNNQTINYKQLTDNLVILLVAGHENPQLLLTTSLYFLGKYKDTWQHKIRNEIENVSEPKTLGELPLLNSFLYEATRMLPPLNTIINRRTSRSCRLGSDIIIPQNTYVGYNNFGAAHEAKSWGTEADKFHPERWGDDMASISKKWKSAKSTHAMSAFHGGRRACLGEKLGMAEMRITIAEMLRNFEWSLSPHWKEKMTPAGPLSPFKLELKLKRLEFGLSKKETT